MRILILTHGYSVHIQRWLDGLRGRGHTLRVLVRQPVNAPDVVAPPAWLAGIAPLRQAWLTATFLELLRIFQPQVLHQHWFEVPRLARFFPADLPLVISTWGADIIRDWQPAALRAAQRYARRAACLLGSSQYLADAASVVLAQPVTCLYWGVDLARFTPQPRASGQQFVIGFMKHLLPKYAPDVALQAFVRVRDMLPAAELHLYGDGSMQAALIAQTHTLGLDAAVHFHGKIPYAEIPAAMAACQVIIMPSRDRSETLGLAALEAQAMGIPVIATHVGGIPEAVHDQIGGILVPPEDPAALAEALLLLARDPALCQRLGQAGRAFVQEHFDWQRTLDGMEEIYTQVIRERADG